MTTPVEPNSATRPIGADPADVRAGNIARFRRFIRIDRSLNFLLPASSANMRASSATLAILRPTSPA